MLKILTTKRNLELTTLNKRSYFEMDKHWISKIKIPEVKKYIKNESYDGLLSMGRDATF